MFVWLSLSIYLPWLLVVRRGGHRWNRYNKISVQLSSPSSILLLGDSEILRLRYFSWWQNGRKWKCGECEEILLIIMIMMMMMMMMIVLITVMIVMMIIVIIVVINIKTKIKSSKKNKSNEFKFQVRGKTWVPGAEPLRAELRTNKLNPHWTSSLEYEPEPHWWRATVQ